MNKLIPILLIIAIVNYGIAYASDYGVNSIESVTEIFELKGRSYRVFIDAQVDSQPYRGIHDFSFEEGGNFKWEPFSAMGDYSGSYTQNGTAFTIHAEWGEEMGFAHEFDLDGTSVLNVFIFGNLTGNVTSDEEIYNWNGTFTGISKLIHIGVE
jgi:hypothetical protein